MPIALQVELLSQKEIDEIWKRGAAVQKAENFAEYLAFMNQRNVGDSFRIPVAKGENNASDAKEIRRNFNLAAKERAGGAVVLSWKVQQHDVTVRDKKTGTESTASVIDALTALVKSSESVQARGPRTQYEAVEVNGMNDAAVGTEVKIAGGRTAKKRKNGKWYAPKESAPAASAGSEAASTESGQNTPSTNGVSEQHSTQPAATA